MANVPFYGRKTTRRTSCFVIPGNGLNNPPVTADAVPPPFTPMSTTLAQTVSEMSFRTRSTWESVPRMKRDFLRHGDADCRGLACRLGRCFCLRQRCPQDTRTAPWSRNDGSIEPSSYGDGGHMVFRAYALILLCLTRGRRASRRRSGRPSIDRSKTDQCRSSGNAPCWA